jgi:biotin carboxylase
VGRLLLLVPATTYRIADFMAAAGEVGADVVIGCDEAQAISGLRVDFADSDAGAAQIAQYGRQHEVAAVIGVDEETCLVAAKASALLGLSHNSPDAVRAAGDKHLFRQKLRAAGLPGPRFTSFGPQSDAKGAAARADFPCVLKPLGMAGSRGVIRADDEAGFVDAWARIKGLPGVGDSILVEDYMPGAEVAVEGILQGGKLSVLALFDKPDPLEGPYFEETIYLTPSRLSPASQAAIAAMTERAAAALGLSEGPVHAELRVRPTPVGANEQGPWMIELAARSIGGLCARSLDFGAGMRLEELIVRHALGLPQPDWAPQTGASGVMMIPIPAAGILSSVEGQGAARATPGITDIVITIAKGGTLVPLPEGDRYLGFIFAKCATPAEAEAALRRAHGELDIIIDPV